MTEYILKPVNPDDFHKVLERAESDDQPNEERKKAARSKRKTSFSSIFSRAISTPAKKRVLQKAGELIDLDKWNELALRDPDRVRCGTF